MEKNHKIYFIISFGLALASLGIALLYWRDLPETIPIHFGSGGQADGWATKSVFQVFLLPIVELLITGLFILLYKKPQYTNMPSTLWLMTLDKSKQETAFKLVRKMLVGTLLWMNILFTYLTFATNEAAMSSTPSISSFFVVLLITAMLIWVGYWTFKVYSTAKEIVKNNK